MGRCARVKLSGRPSTAGNVATGRWRSAFSWSLSKHTKSVAVRPHIYGITEMDTHIQWAGDVTSVSIRSVLVDAHRDSPRFLNNPDRLILFVPNLRGYSQHAPCFKEFSLTNNQIWYRACTKLSLMGLPSRRTVTCSHHLVKHGN